MAIKILYPQLSTLSIIMAIPITLYERRLGDNIQHIHKILRVTVFPVTGRSWRYDCHTQRVDTAKMSVPSGAEVGEWGLACSLSC